MVAPGGEVGPRRPADVLIVGAGPTGLILAAQLRSFGVPFRIIDRLVDRARESRALAVQARSLEVLHALGLATALVSRGRRGGRLQIHAGRGPPVEVTLRDIGAADTRFPYILFVSQAETEAVLSEHLTSRGVTIERGVELVELAPGDEGVHCLTRGDDGREERLRVQYVVGCDGAHSTVRKGAGVAFAGAAYPQEFMLGDVEADGPLEEDVLHAFPPGGALAMFFPLGHPATWRVIAMEPGRPPRAGSPELGHAVATDLSLEELQAIVDRATGGAVRLRDPAWLTRFRLHHRQAERYRAGRVFLAGDAAHIHSPAGGQGMNAGIQDAWNLGWKLALVVRGIARPELLETYEAERWPVGRFLLRYTDRLFGLVARFGSASGAIAQVRAALVRHLVPHLLSRPRLRRYAFQTVSQLRIRYARSPLSTQGSPRLRGGPNPGDRLPDLRVRRGGEETSLQQELAGPCFSLLLCGPPDAWDRGRIAQLLARFGQALAVRHLAVHGEAGALVGPTGEALGRLGAGGLAQYLVRPDGHVGFRCAGADLEGVARYLERWLC